VRAHHSCTRNTRLAQRPAPGKHVTAHDTTPSGDVPAFTTARSWPWALGCSQTRTHACTHVPAETTRMTRRPASRHTAQRRRSTPRHGVARQHERGAALSSRGLERWGAHGRGSGVKPPAQNHHDSKAGTQMCEARRACGARRRVVG
jgi:hypothetical protein